MTEDIIKIYHRQEVVLILFICASDLSNESKENLILYTEAIEGRIDELFERNILKKLFDNLTQNCLKVFFELKKEIMILYSSNWSSKIADDFQSKNINSNANFLLNELKIAYEKPLEFMDKMIL